MVSVSKLFRTMNVQNVWVAILKTRINNRNLGPILDSTEFCTPLTAQQIRKVCLRKSSQNLCVQEAYLSIFTLDKFLVGVIWFTIHT